MGLHDTYILNKGNDAQLYELKGKVSNTRQGSMIVTADYNEINRIWQQMDIKITSGKMKKIVYCIRLIQEKDKLLRVFGRLESRTWPSKKSSFEKGANPVHKISFCHSQERRKQTPIDDEKVKFSINHKEYNAGRFRTCC